MEHINIPGEDDIKRWMKEACQDIMTEWMDNLQKVKLKTELANEPLLSRREVCKILGISTVTLHNWMKKGFPYHHFEGRTYFVRSEFMRFLNIEPSEEK